MRGANRTPRASSKCQGPWPVSETENRFRPSLLVYTLSTRRVSPNLLPRPARKSPGSTKTRIQLGSRFWMRLKRAIY